MRPILILMCVLLFAVPLFAQSPIPDNITADLQKLATDIGQEQSDAANLTAANAALTASASLNGRTMVCWVNAAGTPALSGWPNVSAPEPALTSSESTWP